MNRWCYISGLCLGLLFWRGTRSVYFPAPTFPNCTYCCKVWVLTKSMGYTQPRRRLPHNFSFNSQQEDMFPKMSIILKTEHRQLRHWEEVKSRNTTPLHWQELVEHFIKIPPGHLPVKIFLKYPSGWKDFLLIYAFKNHQLSQWLLHLVENFVYKAKSTFHAAVWQ